MSITLRFLMLAALIAATAGCAHKTKRVLVPTAVELPVRKYVAIPPELTEPCPIAEGRLSEMPDVAKARKQALKDCNGKLKAIRKISDKAVSTNSP